MDWNPLQLGSIFGTRSVNSEGLLLNQFKTSLVGTLLDTFTEL